MSVISTFFEIPELVCHVLGFLPWVDLVRAGGTNQILRYSAQCTIALHISNMLDQFIDRGHHQQFWAMLADSESAISHELPLRLLLYCPNIPPITEPICDLISPAGKGSELATSLLALGYVLVDNPPSDWRVKIENSPEPRMYLAKSDTTKTAWICIKQSTSDNIWESLLAETTTGGMSVITPGFVLSLYPTLTLDRHFVSNTLLGSQEPNFEQIPLLQRHGLHPAPLAESRSEPCDTFCDYLWRSTQHTTGIGLFTWTPLLATNLHRVDYKWRLNDFCQNPFCSKYLLTQRDTSICHDLAQSLSETTCLTPSSDLLPLWNAQLQGTSSKAIEEAYLNAVLSNLSGYFRLRGTLDLRHALRISGAVISGSAALLAICRANFLPNDLDLYVSEFDDFNMLREFLSSCGYASVMERRTGPSSSQYSTKFISRVETFTNEKQTRVIQVIYSVRHAAIAPILNFHSTLLMNYVSAENVVCLYPTLTLIREGKRLNKKTKALTAYSKYTERGFNLLPQNAQEKDDELYSLTSICSPQKLAIPASVPSSGANVEASWILPFSATNATDCAVGLWFDMVDDYVWIEQLAGNSRG